MSSFFGKFLARSSVFSEIVRSVVRFFGNRSAGGIREKFSAGGIRKIISVGRRDSENIFGRNFRSRAQIKDQVMAIHSVQKSSKSELSSGTFGFFKIGQKSIRKYGFLSGGRSISAVSK